MTTSPLRACWLALPWMLSLVGGAVFAQPPAPLDQPPAEEIVEEDLREDTEARLAKAEEVFASAEQPLSIPLFAEIIALLEMELARGDEPPEQTAVDRLQHSRFRRAEANFNIGQRDEAVEDLEAILLRDPAWEAPAGTVSPKLEALVEDVRDRLIGVLDLVVDPPEAEVMLDGRSVGEVVGPLPVLAGRRRLEVRRPGYAPVVQELEVAGGASRSVELSLERLSAVVWLRTRPAGVEIVFEDRVVAVSEPLPEGGDLSTELAVEGLVPGKQILELRKPGYRPRRISIEVEAVDDYELPPVVLEPTRGTVVLSELPSGARLLVDGEPRQPSTESAAGARLDLPPGSHRVQVNAGARGVFEREVELADRQEIELQVRLRPSLVYLGVLGGDREAAGRLEEGVREHLGGLAEWSLLERAEEGLAVVTAAGLDGRRLRDLAAPIRAAQAPDWSAVQSALDDAFAGSTYLLAVLDDDLYATRAVLWLWSAAPGPARPARRTLPLEGVAGMEALAAELDRPLELFTPWLGAQLVDSLLGDSPLVVAVEPGSPAATAGLQAGERLEAIDGRPVASRREVMARLAEQAAGAEATLALVGAGGGRQVKLSLGSSPMIFHLSAGRLLEPALVARLASLAAAGDGTGPPLWLLEVNRGVLLMRAGEWRPAVATLRQISAPDTAGVGQATVDYLLALALLEVDRAGYLDNARRLFERAAASRGRLWHNDGPLLAPRAEARLETLLP